MNVWHLRCSVLYLHYVEYGDATMKPSETFAARLREVRTRKGWTQQQLSERLNDLGRRMDRAALARIETGDRQVSIDELVELSAVLGVTPIHMVIPASGDHLVDIAPELSVSPRQARGWIRGQSPLRPEDAHTYYTEVSVDEIEERYDRTRALLLNLAQSVVDAVTEAAGNLDDDSRNRIADTVDALNRELDRHQGGGHDETP